MYKIVIDLGDWGFGSDPFSYHTWLNGIVILMQRVECNFLPRTTILAISVKEQMENVDRSHKWYWLGYRIPAIQGRGTKK